MEIPEGGRTSDEALSGYFGVLSNLHRDAVVGILADEDRSVQLSLLAEWVAAETRGVSLDALTEQDVERVKVELHHNHLPKLDEAGIVEYAYEEGRVTPTENIGTVSRLRESISAI